MKTAAEQELLFGSNPDSGLVAVEITGARAADGNAALFFRRSGRVERVVESFTPFVLAESEALFSGAPVPLTFERLAGGNRLKTLAFAESWPACLKLKTWLSKKTGRSAQAQDAPFFLLQDPVCQFLALSGRTLFKGMEFRDMKRMQVDIETMTAPGFEFCNPERESDRIILIAMGDESGWSEVLEERGGDEKRLLQRFVETVRERDPDVIEGHNIFNFDLPYLAARAALRGVPLALGRDNSEIASHPSRFAVAEQTMSFAKFEIFGRHVADTYLLLHAYDVGARALDGFGLKAAARHFGISARDRTYIDGSDIAAEYKRDPDRVARYAADDITETRALADILLPIYFAQARLLPYGFQNVCLRGNATKIDALMLREYIRQRRAAPSPHPQRDFPGGYTDIFIRGVVKNVRHCDARSLYPSIMLAERLRPASDEIGVFPRLLEYLRRYRLEAREKALRATDPAEKHGLDSMQSAFKILINSFYGYMGFAQGRFNDYDAAEKVAARGREIIRAMIDKLRELGAAPVEVDTDGIYFTPPPLKNEHDGEKFMLSFRSCLPPGIEVEFDGEYKAMFSYKMKNYALLENDGKIVIRGAALKSRGMERFLRNFLRDYIRLELEDRADGIPALREEYERKLRSGAEPITALAKTETLKDSPANYAAKIKRGGRGRNAAYELALASGREYRAGDQVSYYITGSGRKVAAHSAAKLAAEWDPKNRDENVEYYAAKLDALYKRLESGSNEQDEPDDAGKGLEIDT